MQRYREIENRKVNFAHDTPLTSQFRSPPFLSHFQKPQNSVGKKKKAVLRDAADII